MPSDRPLVYCVVLTCGLKPDGSVKQLLLDTLASLKTMTYPNFKLVVVDNGSTDGSQDAVRSNYPDVTLVENGKNLGFTGGSNVGLQYFLQQQADWVLLLNNDISVDPGMLTAMMDAAKAYPSAGIIAPKIYYFSEPNKIWFAGGSVNFFTGIISHRGIRSVDRGQYDTIEETGYITGCAMLIKREVMKKIGLLDPIYSPMYSEDADYSIRTRRAGFSLLYVPTAKLWHKVSSFTGGGLTPLKTQLKVEHNLLVFRRYASWYHWLTIPIFVLLGSLIFIIKESLKGNFALIGALFKGFINAMTSLSNPVAESSQM